LFSPFDCCNPFYGSCYLSQHACIPIQLAVKTGQPHLNAKIIKSVLICSVFLLSRKMLVFLRLPLQYRIYFFGISSNGFGTSGLFPEICFLSVVILPFVIRTASGDTILIGIPAILPEEDIRAEFIASM